MMHAQVRTVSQNMVYKDIYADEMAKTKKWVEYKI